MYYITQNQLIYYKTFNKNLQNHKLEITARHNIR
jgi:hypothetical protein